MRVIYAHLGVDGSEIEHKYRATVNTSKIGLNHATRDVGRLGRFVLGMLVEGNDSLYWQRDEMMTRGSQMSTYPDERIRATKTTVSTRIIRAFSRSKSHRSSRAPPPRWGSSMRWVRGMSEETVR